MVIWLIVGALLAVLVPSIVKGYRQPTRPDGLLRDAELAQARTVREGQAPSSVAAGHQSTTAGGQRGVSPSASGGGLGLGVLMIGGGLFLDNHFGPLAQVCQSGAGAIGQALEPHAQTDCTLDSGLAELGTFLSIGGGVIVVLTVVVVLVLLFDAHKHTGA